MSLESAASYAIILLVAGTIFVGVLSVVLHGKNQHIFGVLQGMLRELLDKFNK